MPHRGGHATPAHGESHRAYGSAARSVRPLCRDTNLTFLLVDVDAYMVHVWPEEERNADE